MSAQCRGCSGTCCTGQGSEPCTCPDTDDEPTEIICWRGKCDNDPNEYMLCARWQRREPGCYEEPEPKKKSLWAMFVRSLADVLEDW